MKIREVMTKGAEVVTPESSLADAARKMKDLNVGMLPVCDGDTIRGTLTDRDLVIKSMAQGQNPRDAKVSAAMSEGVEWCFDDMDVGEVMGKMKKAKVRRLPVINHEKRLVGIVSLGDLACGCGEKAAGETLEGISEPSEPQR
ncbi:MAG: CBS domain-containing protein [Candidatus Omnitrophica bacterium]|nr:CBS domain-containing protein [Candidatus Omnitrophota bacterium]